MATKTEADLQLRYTELLEKRIAQLEGLFKSDPPKVDSSATTKDAGVTKENKATETDPDPKKDEAAKPTTRYRNILRKWDRTAGVHKDEDVSAASLKPESKDVAYTFRRVYDPETGEKGAYSELDIEGEGLIALLKSVIDNKYPGINFDGELVNMSAPFAPIVHNWDLLKKKLEDTPESQASKDLAHLLDRIQASPELEKYFKIRKPNADAQITTYETLWTCFAPKTRIVAKPFMNTPQILEVLTSPIPFSTPVESTLDMWAFCWDWNGNKMIRVFYQLKFERFRGTKPINELAFYPIQFDPSKDQIFAKVKERSIKYIKCVTADRGASQMFTYRGDAYVDRRKVIASADEDEDNEGGSKRLSDEERLLGKEKFSPKMFPIKGEFICDAAAFLQYGSGSHVLGEWEETFTDEDPREADGTPISFDIQKALEDDTHQLFPPRLLGYATREKMWGQFFVDDTQTAPGTNTKPFQEDLQLEPKYKEMIEALVNSHESFNTERGKQLQVKDVVQDKGRGLVLLLHGPPGVGKTLTAETIATATGKPLFIVSVAEIGLNASRAERNLEKLFNLASKWEAILLVDEADVFLETRGTSSSAGRNALVSVLLRVLEYYQGIIILTTNRIKSIDVAVISRIHLAIRYTDLTETQMCKIFSFFLDQLEPDWIEDRKEINNFIENYGHQYKLNGRQIRNVVSGALASARNSAKKKKGSGKLTFKHLKEVCEMTRNFEEQLKENTMAQRFNNEAINK